MSKYEEKFNKGTIALNNRKFQEALKYFKEANKMVDNDPELFCNMGVTYLQMNELETALSWLERALIYDAYNPITLLNVGLINSMNGNYDKAVNTLEKLLEHNPDFSQARPFLMQIKRQRDLFGSLDPEGKNIPEKALEFFKTGLGFTHRNRLPEAVESIKSAIKEYAEFAEAYLFLGIIEQMSNNPEAASKNFDSALEHDPNLFLAWIHKGWVYDSQKLFEKAIECYDKGIALNSTHSSSYNNKGLALDALERYEEAIQCYTKSIELNPDFEGMWYNRATTYKKSGQLERALADYKKTLELDPRHEYAKEDIDHLKHYSTMGVEGTMRTVVDGRDYCPRCGKKKYTNENVCPYCGTQMEVESVDDLLQTVVEDEAIGNFERAIMTLIRINEREPTLGQAWFYRGKAHCAMGEFKNALMCFGKSQQLGFNPFQIMMYGLAAKNNISNFEPPNLSEKHISQVEAKPAGYFLDEKSWTANGAALQMLMEYERAYKCYLQALKKNNNYSLARKNMEIIAKLAKIGSGRIGRDENSGRVERKPQVNIMRRCEDLLQKYFKENRGAYSIRDLENRLDKIISNDDEKEYGRNNLEKLLNKMRSNGIINSKLHNGEDHYFIP